MYRMASLLDNAKVFVVDPDPSTAVVTKQTLRDPICNARSSFRGEISWPPTTIRNPAVSCWNCGFPT